MLSGPGVSTLEVTLEPGTHPLLSPEDWWLMVLGSGYRGTIERLDEKSRERVRQDNLNFIRESGVRSVEANVIYGVATMDHVATD